MDFGPGFGWPWYACGWVWYRKRVDWSKVWGNFQKLPTFVKEEFGPIGAWVGLLAGLVPVGIGLIISKITASILVVIAYYLAVGLIAALSRYTKLEAKQEPRIEILWGKEHPYIDYGKFLNVGEIERLWRVGVTNPSPVSTVSDIEIKLIEMEPRVNVVIPAPLHMMGDNPLNPAQPYALSLDIHPKDTKYMDVIGHLKSNELFIYYADKALPQTLPIRKGSEQYGLTIKVVGRDISARERQFKTYFDGNGKFVMEPVGESYESAD